MELFRTALRWYDKQLYVRPYFTQMVTNGPLWGMGDLSAQWLERMGREEKKPLDWSRTARFSIYGFCVAGPLFAWWYGYIERRWMHLRLKGDWTKYLVAKIGCDQVRKKDIPFQSPLEPLIDHYFCSTSLHGAFYDNFPQNSQFLFEPLYLLQFFGTMGAMKGSSKQEIKQLIEEEYVSTFVVDTAVWPLAQAFNFRFVPARFQALYVNAISLGWAGFLSLVTNPEPRKEELPKPIAPRKSPAVEEFICKPSRP